MLQWLLTATEAVRRLLRTLGGAMKSDISDRREFFVASRRRGGCRVDQCAMAGGIGCGSHAHQAVKTKKTTFEVLTAEQAKEVQAIAACLIPTDEMPGATEAGVVYFIDHALKTFASDALPDYQKGLPHVNEIVAEMFPGTKNFSAATPEQQVKVIEVLSGSADAAKTSLRRAPSSVGTDFFQTILFHSMAGFLVDPEGGGNRDYAGWKVIGRDPAHSFSPPFGFYDKDYPGWQPAPETEKK